MYSHGLHCSYCSRDSFLAKSVMEDHPELFRKLDWKWAKTNGRYQGNYCESCLRGTYEEVQPEDCYKCGYPRCSHLGFKCVVCNWQCCLQCKLGIHDIPRRFVNCDGCSSDICRDCLIEGSCPDCPPVPAREPRMVCLHAQMATIGPILPLDNSDFDDDLPELVPDFENSDSDSDSDLPELVPDGDT